jgi:prolipoprotein diacylglyceryl transferase
VSGATAAHGAVLAAIPSPHTNVWHLGPLPVHGYALCILAGIVAATIITDQRLRRRGVPPWAVLDIAIWAVPAGVIGARLYHVATDPELYFASGRHPLDALKIWTGGLGIWGAVVGGAAGAWIACRRSGIGLSILADAAAPALPVAQAIGRLGNYLNQELFGGPTALPWGLTIDPAHRPAGYTGYTTFHPTFAYEMLWDLGVAAFVLAMDRRLRLRRGQAFALYVMAYVVGRFWIEHLRIDTANHFLGLRLNDWTCLIVFAAAAGYFRWAARRWVDADHRPPPIATRPAMNLAHPDGGDGARTAPLPTSNTSATSRLPERS